MTRRIEKILCSCGGIVKKVKPTSKEDIELGCGKQGCCNGAYKCEKCKVRWVVVYEAPDLDW